MDFNFKREGNNNSDIIILKLEWFIEILVVAYKDDKKILKYIRESVDNDKRIIAKKFENNNKF